MAGIIESLDEYSRQLTGGNKMAASLRGQLGLKSSPLCPTASKLTTQYLVLDHMNNHYKKLSNVKPSIDNTPPKSIAKSQKVRDRCQRSQSSRPASRYSDRPVSRNTGYHSRLADSDIYDETYWGNAEDEEETSVMSIMKNVLKRPSRESSANRKGNAEMEKTMDWPRSASAMHQRETGQLSRPVSARSMGSAMSRTGTHTAANKTSGDVLEKRSHAFTEPDRPFTPRTLKSTRGSRLLEYKYYTPPKKSSSKRDKSDREKNVDDGPVDSQTSPMQHTAPTPKPRKRIPSANSKLDVTQDSENTLMYETLQTRDLSRARADKTQMVPPLDISVDKDHMNWLQEQATKAQIRVSARSSEGGKDRGVGHRSPRDLRRSGDQNRGFGSSRSWAQERLSSEEEELRYVEFVRAVTQDVLNRGIFTNRVLLHAFENHIEKNKRHLDERKMRSLLAQLREDLGIPSSREADMDADNVGHSSRQSSGYRRGELHLGSTLTPEHNPRTYNSLSLEKTGTDNPQGLEDINMYNSLGMDKTGTYNHHGDENTGMYNSLSLEKTVTNNQQGEENTGMYNSLSLEKSGTYSQQGLETIGTYNSKNMKKAVAYNKQGLDRTGTTTWLSEDGGTLRTTQLGETTEDNNMMTLTSGMETKDSYDESAYTGTVENDGDELSVTQALKTYQLTISKQDSLENHLAADYTNNSILSQGSKTEEEAESRAASEVSGTGRSERETPRAKRRLRRQQSQVSDGFLESASQVDDNDKQSVMSLSRQSGKSLHGVASPSSQFSKHSHRNTRPQLRGGKQQTPSDWRSSDAETQRRYNLDVDQADVQGRSALGNRESSTSITNGMEKGSKCGDPVNGRSSHHNSDHESNVNQYVNHGSHVGNLSDHGSEFSDPHGGGDESADPHGRGDKSIDIHGGGSKSGYTTDQGFYAHHNGTSRDDSRRNESIASHSESAKSSNPGQQHAGRSSDDQLNDPTENNANQHKDKETNANHQDDNETNVDEYEDDYEEDMADADDEDATTVTHRSSDDDF